MSVDVDHVPHRVNISFDLVHCNCGWYMVDAYSDRAALEGWKKIHEQRFAGELLEVTS